MVRNIINLKSQGPDGRISLLEPWALGGTNLPGPSKLRLGIRLTRPDVSCATHPFTTIPRPIESTTPSSIGPGKFLYIPPAFLPSAAEILLRAPG